MAGCLAGCGSSRGGEVEMACQGQKHTYIQKFNEAYYAVSKEGDYDAIFVDNAMERKYEQPKKKKKGNALAPTALAPMRQVMHVHLYWRPMSGATKNPAAINASIDWYVLGPDGSKEMLVYEGAGLVSVDESEEQEHVVLIRDGQIRPKMRRGNLNDPVGAASLTAEVTARRNDSRVREIVAEMEKQIKDEGGRRQ